MNAEEAPWGGGASGVAPSLETLENMLRKSPDAAISLHMGPFLSEWNLLCVGGCSYSGDFDR
jgi:hypothetical protein